MVLGAQRKDRSEQWAVECWELSHPPLQTTSGEARALLPTA